MCRRLKQIIGVPQIDPVSPICLQTFSLLQKIQREKHCSPFKMCFRVISFPCSLWLSLRGKSELRGKKPSFTINVSVGGTGPSLDLILVSEPRHRFSFLLDRFTQNCLMLATCITHTANTYYICIDSTNERENEI